MNTTTMNTGHTKTVSLGWSRHGNPEPEMALWFPKGTHYRIVKAALHNLAAEVELATPSGENWIVTAEDHHENGRVYLELSGATAAEAERGMALLKALAG